MAFVPVSAFTGRRVQGVAQVCRTPARAARWTMEDKVHTGEGKGFGGGEATRDPDPTEIDPNDPKGKQKAIHPVETFAEYSARKAREAKEKA